MAGSKARGLPFLSCVAERDVCGTVAVGRDDVARYVGYVTGNGNHPDYDRARRRRRAGVTISKGTSG